MGERYQALMRVARLPLDDSAEDGLLAECLDQITQCRQEAAAYRAEPGLTGATRDAALSWLDEYDRVLARRAEALQGSKGQHDQARDVMRQARDKANELPVQLMSRGEKAVFATEPELLLEDGTRVSGRAYAAALERERDEERELQAEAILSEMNSSMQAIPPDPPPIDTSEIDSSGTGEAAGGVPGARGSRGAGASGTTGPGGGWASSAGAAHVGSSAVAASSGLVGAAVLANRATAGATSGSSHWARPVPTGRLVTDPAELTHKKLSEMSVHPPMSSDGSTRGYVPPSILDRDDPRWSESHVPDGFEDRAGTSRAGMLVGGVLGAGASALAARGATSGLSGLSLSGSGAAGLVGRVPGTGMLGTGSLSSTVGSASAGAGSPTSAGIAGQMGAGQSGTTASPASSAATARSGPQASSASRGMMAPHAGGSRQGRDRDRATLVGYDVQRLDDGSFQEHTAGDSAAAGSASALTPLHSEDSGEEW
ncbi:MAG: hypothetical protein L0K65_01195 [Actinomyces sp.]|nr:hypothetical protein [Actinomyces sp.]